METTAFGKVWSVIRKPMAWCLSAMGSPGIFLFFVWFFHYLLFSGHWKQAGNPAPEIGEMVWVWALMYGLGRIAKAIEESNAIARSKQEAPKS